MADVVRSTGDAVLGPLYHLHDADVVALDAYKAFDPLGPEDMNEYRRRSVTVTAETEGSDVEAHGDLQDLFTDVDTDEVDWFAWFSRLSRELRVENDPRRARATARV